jgi:hypothetical protein
MAQSFDSKTDGIFDNVKVASLISDLDGTVRQLDCDILAEEKRTLVSDPNDIKYPPLARSLRTRRDNLRATIATLELKASGPRDPIGGLITNLL